MGKVSINKNHKILPTFLQGRTSKLDLALAWVLAAVLVLIPFHAFLTVWLASLVGHYTLLRLWKEFLLLPIVVGAGYILLTDKTLHKKLRSLWLIRLIALYCALLALCGLLAFTGHNVSAKAVWYGLLLDLRFLILFVAVLVTASKTTFLEKNWQKILIGPAVLVSAFAVLQYLVLPYDFLKHFGYGPSTIFPYETINHNLNHLRVASTLRGANPLGAYLILPISALGVLLLKEKREKTDKLMIGLGLGLALAFSFSRSAWIGAFLSILIIAWAALKTNRLNRYLLWGFAAFVVIAGLAAFSLRHNTTFEDAFLHTDHNSQAVKSSNQGHATAFRDGARDIIHQPLGRGPGTAGPASIYNSHPRRIAENYFLQTGQEAGLVGMALFIAINLLVGQALWLKKKEPLALALFASLIGLTFVNLLSHAWTDDTLAYLWWGLAGIALTPAILKTNKANGKTHSQKP